MPDDSCLQCTFERQGIVAFQDDIVLQVTGWYRAWVKCISFQIIYAGFPDCACVLCKSWVGEGLLNRQKRIVYQCLRLISVFVCVKLSCESER